LVWSLREEFVFCKEKVKPGVVVHDCNPSTGETEASLGYIVQSQAETLSQKKKKKVREVEISYVKIHIQTYC
jgi:hypothetical protein